MSEPTAPRAPLPGSVRPPTADGPPVDGDAVVEATIVLRRRAVPDAAAFTGPPLSRADLAARYGADPAERDAVVAAVRAAGAEVVSADTATRLVRVRGPVTVLAGLFGADLVQARTDEPGSRRRRGGLSLPEALAGRVVAVLGLDDRPQAAARFRPAAAAATGFTPPQLAAAYGMPEGDGAGRTIAVIELGGGFGQDDLDAYFGELGLPTPTVTAVGVDGARNVPGGDPDGADGEVLLDIEVAGGIAPGAAQLVYFAPNTDDGFVDAVTQAAHADPAPTAMSISWGASEDAWTPQARDALDAALADAALLGVTVTAAAGDNGSDDGTPTGAPHVDFPASSPHVLACGGTRLVLDASGAVADESVWNSSSGGATGGGVSRAFPTPDWQAGVAVPVRAGDPASPGRGVPDVAAVADPQTGHRVRVDGRWTVIGGTSAVSPLWAGLVCRLAQSLDRPLGLLQPALYAAASVDAPPPGIRDVLEGDNGAYAADPGWDACTGLGVPAPGLLDALRDR